ncbi:Clp protease N-terminal domain-containing protein [Nocardia sp. NPDC004068]|uniref:Clp protease N-terminal domain-containing protein n=1 Tax=Nocardia sp. NPDC004068 TaxID=3364303 RepID=UPI0036C5FC7A
MTDAPKPTPRYQQIIAAATAAANDMGHDYVGVEHLFLAIVRDPWAVPTQALRRVGAEGPAIEEVLLSIMRSDGYNKRGHTQDPKPE